MDDSDIWCTAGTLLSLYGADEAVLVAARRTDALLDQGDTEGYFVWKRVTQAIDDLRRSKPRSDDPIH
jgi:hypothetical protein